MVNEELPQEELEPIAAPRFGAGLIPWLLLIALVLLFVPLYIGSVTIEDAADPLATESDMLQATITAPPAPPEQEQTLTARLLTLRSELAPLENIPPTLVAAHVDWPAIMSALHSYDANSIQLTGFNHTGNQLVLQGNGLEESAVLDYANTLQGTGFFAAVHVQAIAINPVAPATPSSQTNASLTETYMPFIFTLSLDLEGGDSNGSG